MSYKAIVTRIKNLRPFPGADRLLLAQCLDFQIVVGKDDFKENELVLFFRDDGCLSEEFCIANKFYRKDPITGEDWSGMFEPNGRVKCIKLRGQKSEGFACPLSALDNLFGSKGPAKALEEGDEFDTLLDKKICSKYYTPATLRSGANRQLKKININPNFKEHFDTENIAKNWNSIPIPCTVYVSNKMEGSSGRFAYLKDPIQNNHWWTRLRNWFMFLFNLQPVEYYSYYNGTRRTVIVNQVKEQKGDCYRWYVVSKLYSKLLPGETLYYEIVGFDHNGKAIADPQTIDKKAHKELFLKFGPKMIYSYGCDPKGISGPQQRIFVYRITQLQANGQIKELNQLEMEGRCLQLYLETVPLLWEATVNSKEDLDLLRERVKQFNDNELMEDIICPTHISEGVSIRIEQSNKFVVIYKSKNLSYKILSGIQKSNDSYVDIEDIN